MSEDGSVESEARVPGELLRFEEIFKLHHRKVYSLCLRMTGVATDAEDLSQEVFVQVFRKLGSFRGESAFTTWLHRLTINQVLMHFRKRRSTKVDLTEDGELPDQTIQGTDVPRNSTILDRLALDEAILKLAPGYRTVFVLHDIEGLEHLEIASILGCSVGTSKSQLHQARMKLRTLLQSRIHAPEETTAIQPTQKNLDRLPSTPPTQVHQAITHTSKSIRFSPAQA